MSTSIRQPSANVRLFPLIVRLALRKFLRDDMSTHACALAYHILFSFFPFAIFVIALLSFFELSVLLDYLQQAAWQALSPRAMERIRAAFNELRVPQGGLLSFGALLSAWLASRGTRSMMNAFNVAYRCKTVRPVWQHYIASIAYTVGIAVILTIGLAMLVVGPDAIGWIASFVGLHQSTVPLWTWLRWPMGLGLLTASVAVVYHVAPDTGRRFRLVSPGAVISVIVWATATLAFKYYLQNFANYSAMFGSIGSGIALLLYLQISSAVLLFGAEVNAVWTRIDIITKACHCRPATPTFRRFQKH